MIHLNKKNEAFCLSLFGSFCVFYSNHGGASGWNRNNGFSTDEFLCVIWQSCTFQYLNEWKWHLSFCLWYSVISLNLRSTNFTSIMHRVLKSHFHCVTYNHMSKHTCFKSGGVITFHDAGMRSSSRSNTGSCVNRRSPCSLHLCVSNSAVLPSTKCHPPDGELQQKVNR